MKIHFLSNSLKTNSGFAVVVKNLAQEFKLLGHEITMSGFQTATVPEYTYNIESLPMATDYDEITQFKKNLMEIDPDVVFYVGEVYTNVRNLWRIFPRTILYVPIEGIGIPNFISDDLNSVATNGGRVVAQCSYGFNQMINNDVQSVGYIYHGYNERIFKQLQQSELTSRYCFYSTDIGRESINPRKLSDKCYNCSVPLSEQMFCPKFKDEIISFCKYTNKGWTESDFPIYKLKEELNNKFVFLFIGQNHFLRKKIDRLMKAFTLLLDSKQMKDRVHLHLHTKPQSITGIDLLQIANNLGIQENISFSYGTWRSSGWSEESISKLYNLSDVNVTATSSEGFGLPFLESMACGIPQVGSDCTSLTELISTPSNNKEESQIGQRGLLAKISDSDLKEDMTTRQLVDIIDLSSKMKEIYTNKELREECSKNCLEFVKPYTWNQIAKKFDKVLTEMVKK